MRARGPGADLRRGGPGGARAGVPRFVGNFLDRRDGDRADRLGQAFGAGASQVVFRVLLHQGKERGSRLAEGGRREAAGAPLVRSHAGVLCSSGRYPYSCVS